MKKLITEEHVEENVLNILNIIRGSNEEYLPGGTKANSLRKINPNVSQIVINNRR